VGAEAEAGDGVGTSHAVAAIGGLVLLNLTHARLGRPVAALFLLEFSAPRQFVHLRLDGPGPETGTQRAEHMTPGTAWSVSPSSLVAIPT
jgi:hypothetical protein